MNQDKQEPTIVIGTVIEALPNTHFRVQLESGKDDENLSSEDTATEEPSEIIAYLRGKMRKHHIRVLVGDSVEVQLDEYGGKARIIRRL